MTLTFNRGNHRPMRSLIFCLILVFLGCAPSSKIPSPAGKISLQPVSFESLPGWGSDDFSTFVTAFEETCERILECEPSDPMGSLEEAGTVAEWQLLCRNFMKAPKGRLRAFFESQTRPYLVTDNGNQQGLFTGYFESSLHGSLDRIGAYQTPLHSRPDDLVMVSLGDFRKDLNGRHIAGRVIDGQLQPYESRREIVAGGEYPHNNDVLVWLDDPIDAFFVHVQGSGHVELPDGNTMRISHAGRNGHPYHSIGRELIQREEIAEEDMSMQAIRQWLIANPEQADEVMHTNASYIFFREIDADGPLGAEGVTLTPGRSLAIDHSLLSYGLPIWVDIEAPIESAPPLQRLMVTQDTGSAIRGAVRGDVFWGRGEEAEKLAGGMKSSGRYWVLLPKP